MKKSVSIDGNAIYTVVNSISVDGNGISVRVNGISDHGNAISSHDKGISINGNAISVDGNGISIGVNAIYADGNAFVRRGNDVSNRVNDIFRRVNLFFMPENINYAAEMPVIKPKQVKIMSGDSRKTYKLLDADGKPYESRTKGTLGGHRRDKIYGTLDCKGAARWIAKGFYVKQRVFFADEQTALAAGFRPCANCLPEKYREWKRSISEK